MEGQEYARVAEIRFAMRRAGLQTQSARFAGIVPSSYGEEYISKLPDDGTYRQPLTNAEGQSFFQLGVSKLGDANSVLR